MAENANSAFAFFGRSLARRVATVPVGVPDTAIKVRRYTSDTRQPIHESFIHGVAALCCLRHFLDPEPCSPGLYQMGAEDPTRLGGRNRLPGGAGNDTVQSLANQAATLADVLDVFARTLSMMSGGGPFRVLPAIYLEVERLAAPEQVGAALHRLVADYRKHVEWMKDVLGVEPRPDLSLTREASSRKRLPTHRLEPTGGGEMAGNDAAALALLHWTADWIREFSRGDGAPALVSLPALTAHGGHWPPLVGHDSLNVAAETPGQLTQVPDHNIQGTVQGFIREENIAQNGWPYPMAAADHFRYAIEHEHPTERRQLEMLLAGVVMGKLTLRDIPPRESSLDRLVDEYRKTHLPELARVAVVHEHHDGDVVLGFNSPHTLLCPTPIASDEKREGAWSTLWQALTGSEQPSDWRTEEIAKWHPAGLAIRQIRTWIEGEKRAHGGASPAWTQVFAGDPAPAPATFGTGRTLSVYWGTGTEAARVTIALPTSSSGDYWPDEQTPPIDENDLLAKVPALRSVTTDAGVTFQMVEFTQIGPGAATRAFWREHLDHLQRSGDIAAFGTRPDDRKLAILSADRRSVAIIENVTLLDRNDMMVRDCTPMRQEPVRGSSTQPGRVLYPDYPLCSDYLGLLETDDGRRVVDLLKLGEHVHASPPSIDATATWELRLAGRSDRLCIVLPVPQIDAADDEDEYYRAHWMVWPRFRSAEAPYWRAYYVYEHCSVARLRLSTLWFDPDYDCVRRCAPPERAGAYPVRFRVGDQRAHAGGPPIAFCLENSESGHELGLYLLNLQPLGRRQTNVKVGIDFGTSHTVAAVQADGKKHLVELSPELDPALHDPLTLHVSENGLHVTDPVEGLKRLGVWLPTYSEGPAPTEREGLLPSELLTIKPLASLSGVDPSQWQPGLDCVIPFMDMQRRDLADHLLADFKWKASFEAFRGREPVLRETYLGMAMELVMADVAWRRLRALPAQVDFTFTYPLRDSPEQVQDYEDTLRRVIESGTRSLGGNLRLAEGIGIYNESSAARGGTRVFGEVCLVGDLGGGTLDLFISAYGRPGIEFEEVADSAKLGGNELLRTMAEHPDLFLPQGWASRPGDVQTQLRAWMRSKGSALLFGDSTGEAERHPGLDVSGFAQPGAAGAARALIERYFWLIVEYMARSLVAYLVRHWYSRVLENHPGDHDRLRVLVQLRGNGWRLWPDSTRYAEIEQKVASDVAARAREMWRDRATDRDAWHGLDNLWRKHGLWGEVDEGTGTGPAVDAPAGRTESSHNANPKAAPILRVVGQAQRHDEVRAYSHALVQLEVLNGTEPRIRWFDRLPVRTGGVGAKVEFHRIEPPFALSHPDAVGGVRQELDDVEQQLKEEINKAIEDLGVMSGVHFSAPIAPLVWEHAFKSRRFVEGK